MTYAYELAREIFNVMSCDDRADMHVNPERWLHGIKDVVHLSSRAYGIRYDTQEVVDELTMMCGCWIDAARHDDAIRELELQYAGFDNGERRFDA